MMTDEELQFDKDRLDVSEIDGFWLQRLLSKHHKDAIDAQVI
jgi:hypothetical protein